MLSKLSLRLVLVSCIAFSRIAFSQSSPPTDQNARNSDLTWPPITAITKPWTRWWWMGNAVDTDSLDRELQRYQTAGLGGVEVTPIYGVNGWENRDIPYLSPKWMEMLDHAITTSHKLGMLTDMTMGTGWCFGGPTVTNDEANALVTSYERQVAAGASITGTYNKSNTQALMAYGDDGTITDLMANIDATGHVQWKAKVPSLVYAISQKPSPQMVKRAAPGAEGHMLNPFYTTAVQHYLQGFDKPFSQSPPALNAVFQDSYEYVSNWSPDLLDQFQKMRGYKLENELPALLDNGTDDTTSRVKSDYRETISDMMIEKSMPAWIAWSHAHGFQARYQAHGAPANLLDLYGMADVPETEIFFKDRNVLVTKFASSAAHVMNRPLASAETGTWLAEHFTETLAQLKYLADDMFLGGINHIIYHGTTYSPDEAPWPGWCFYASTEMNPRNALWHDVGTLNNYIARCQSILQGGKPDNDILLYWPIYDLWASPDGMEQRLAISGDWLKSQPVGKTAQLLWDRGYCFDYISDRQIATANVNKGAIFCGDVIYKAIVIPPTNYMPPETLKHLIDLANAGVPVFFDTRLPNDVPGLASLKKRRAAFKDLLSSVATNNHITVGDVEPALQKTDVKRETIPDQPGLQFVRRNNAYFIANRGNTPFDGWLRLNITQPINSLAIVLMDPMTGQTSYALTRLGPDGCAEVRLRLDPGESIFLREGYDSTDASRLVADWAQFKPQAVPIEIHGTWKIQFLEGGPAIPPPIVTSTLASWTTLGGVEAQSFSGTARYTLTFDAPNNLTGPCDLSLGEVHQSARIRLNGTDLGTAIIPPFRIRIDSLKPKANLLELEVTNTSANRIRDLDRRQVPWKIFHAPNVLNTAYKPFDASSWPLAPSGLIGPVTLIPDKK